jgi:16S rRNA (cytosine1402-N4)-methyltransferase
MTIPMPIVAGMGTLGDATPGFPAPDGAGHRPVLLTPLIESLQPRPGQTAIDATLGAGGVTAALLERVSPGGRVIAIDRDQSAVEAARRRFADHSDAVQIAQGDFADLETIVRSLGVDAADVVVFDLGISSLQLDDPARGFSFRHDGPLDMRMDPSSGETAAQLVDSLTADELTSLIREYGDERFARSIANRIARTRELVPLTTTTQLRELVEQVVPRRFWPKRIHPATRTFQALRIAVNHELESLERGLQAAISILRPGGRLGVISFHSLEDTLVKNALHVAAQNCICPPQQPHCTCVHRATLFLLTRKVIRPDSAELATNPRSRSARLRVAEKLAAPGLPRSLNRISLSPTGGAATRSGSPRHPTRPALHRRLRSIVFHHVSPLEIGQCPTSVSHAAPSANRLRPPGVSTTCRSNPWCAGSASAVVARARHCRCCL